MAVGKIMLGPVASGSVLTADDTQTPLLTWQAPPGGVSGLLRLCVVRTNNAGSTPSVETVAIGFHASTNPGVTNSYVWEVAASTMSIDVAVDSATNVITVLVTGALATTYRWGGVLYLDVANENGYDWAPA